MPKPHYPSQGGLHHRYGPMLPPPTTERKKSERRKPEADRQALEDEVERLRRELARAQTNGGPRSASETTRLLWAVVALCGGGLIFAIVALLRHG